MMMIIIKTKWLGLNKNRQKKRRMWWIKKSGVKKHMKSKREAGQTLMSLKKKKDGRTYNQKKIKKKNRELRNASKKNVGLYIFWAGKKISPF